jgi:hypothetical protein
MLTVALVCMKVLYDRRNGSAGRLDS